MYDLRIFARTIEDQAQEQIKTLLSQDAFKHCKVRIMPDVHAGAGCVIGFTANLGDKVIPNIVGVDIGCGMLTVPLGKIDINYSKLDRVIREYIPSGMNVQDCPQYAGEDYIKNLRCFNHLRNKDWLFRSMGTLGGGNHFIEVDQDDTGYKYLIIHTGSRNIGKQVAEYYQDLAIKNLTTCSQVEIDNKIEELKDAGRYTEIQSAIAEMKKKRKDVPPKDLCYLEGIYRDDYLYDMKLCQKYAELNRYTIAAKIIKTMKWFEVPMLYSFETVHNYIDNFNMVRKGAVSAHYGQRVLIPINMKDGCILGVGKGNIEWNRSAPHGAGRIISRTEARNKLSLDKFRDDMTDIYTTSIGLGTLDEAPDAYRGIDEILECIKPTVHVTNILKPVYNFKADN